jgi:hypothetical protein
VLILQSFVLGVTLCISVDRTSARNDVQAHTAMKISDVVISLLFFVCMRVCLCP